MGRTSDWDKKVYKMNTSKKEKEELGGTGPCCFIMFFFKLPYHSDYSAAIKYYAAFMNFSCHQALGLLLLSGGQHRIFNMHSNLSACHGGRGNTETDE